MTRMMDLVADTRRLAYGSMSDQLAFLAEPAAQGAGELKMVGSVDSITPGMVLSSGLNVYYVIGTIPAERRVLVYPTYDNSKADALPEGSPVMIRPRATDWMLFSNLNDIIRSLSSSTHGLYREGSWTLPVDATWQSYGIPLEAEDMTSLIKAQVRAWGSVDVWVDLDPNMVIVDRASNIVRLTRDFSTGTEIRFLYRAPFKTATSLTDDVVADLGLAETMVDIPPIGAAVGLLLTTESRRSQIHNQGDPRRAGEVTPGMNTNSARQMERSFNDRVSDEYARLVNRNSIRRSI